MGRLDVEQIPYEEYSNRQLAAIPLAVLAVALLVILGAYFLTGTPVDLGMAFTGGTEIRVDAQGASTDDVRATFSDLDTDSVRSVGQGDSYIIATQNTDTGQYEQAAEEAGYEVESIQTRSASFGSDTQQQAIIGIVVAFVGMSLLVALIFRTFVPSLAIVASAFSDIVIPIALMNIFGIQLTLGSVAALLMIIGYSVDSDILLNNHVLKRHGSFYESAYRAMRTGVSMTLTSIAAMVTMALVASNFIFGIPLLDEIALVLVFGLTADLMNTYLLNMSLLRWYKFEGVAK
jgi:preprotein translocase subunit SecF